MGALQILNSECKINAQFIQKYAWPPHRLRKKSACSVLHSLHLMPQGIATDSVALEKALSYFIPSIKIPNLLSMIASVVLSSTVFLIYCLIFTEMWD